MSFKELNLNKGFNKPKYREKEKPKLENKELKNKSDKPQTSPKVRIELQKPKLEKNPENIIENPKQNTYQRIKTDYANSSPKINPHHKIIASTRKVVVNPKDKILKHQEIQQIKINPKRRYMTKPVEIKLDKYINPVVDGWLYNVKKRQIQLRLDSGKRYISKNDRNFAKVYNLRRFYNYAGLVYRIIENGTGKIRYGSTLGTLEGRWRWYKKDALRNINNPNNTPFHRRIIESLKPGKDIDKCFIMRPVDICFDVNTLGLREDYWIKKHKTQDPSKGYNIKGGGVGIKLDVPISKIVSGIASGYNIEDIRISLSNSTGMNFSRKTISRRIKQYWGGKNEARKRFLKPVLEKIIRDGYKTNDITHSFGNFGRNIVERIIPQMFEKKSFSELRRYYLKKDLKKYITMGIGPKAIDRELKYHGLTEINNAIKEEWGNLDLAQKKLWKPLIISRIGNGDHPSKILIDFGYSENSAKSQYNRVLKRLFNGMTYNQIKEKIKDSLSYDKF